jgi:putative FmdB family regulatory protein
MPIYEYRCTDCEKSFETFVRTGRDEAECPSCHGTNLVREMSVFASGSADGDNAAVGESLVRSGGCCGGRCGCGH